MATIVKTSMLWLYLAVPVAWSRLNRASKASACFCFKSKRARFTSRYVLLVYSYEICLGGA